MILYDGTNYGNKLLSRDFDKLAINIYTHNAEDSVPAHAHKRPYLSLLLDGNYLEKPLANVSQMEISNKCVVYRPAYYEHSNEIGKQLAITLNIEIKNSELEELVINESTDSLSAVENSIEFAKVSAGLIHNYDDDILELLTLEAFSNIESSKIRDRKDNFEFKVIDYLEENFTESISLSKIAEYFNVHPVYLSRRFKSSINKTIGEYLRDIRLRESFHSLFNSEEKLVDIGLSNGFYDQAHFTKLYKQAFNKTPSFTRKGIQKLI